MSKQTEQTHKAAPAKAAKPKAAPIQQHTPPASSLLQLAREDPASLTPAQRSQLQRTFSNRALSQLVGKQSPRTTHHAPLRIQPKLQVNAVGDKYEQEADAVAKEVVQKLNAPQPIAAPPAQAQRQIKEDELTMAQRIQRQELPEEEMMAQREAIDEEEMAMPQQIQRQEIEEEEPQNMGMAQRQEAPEDEELQLQRQDDTEDEVQLQRQEMAEEELQNGVMTQRQPQDYTQGGTVDNSVEAQIDQTRGGGRAMDNAIRQPLEQAFGADFSNVRIHTDAQAHNLNQAIQARAFTTGKDIFFKQGEYSPANTVGQELLAHELTHVIQQTVGFQRQEVEHGENKPQEANLSPASKQIRKFIDENVTDIDLLFQKMCIWYLQQHDFGTNEHNLNTSSRVDLLNSFESIFGKLRKQLSSLDQVRQEKIRGTLESDQFPFAYDDYNFDKLMHFFGGAGVAADYGENVGWLSGWLLEKLDTVKAIFGQLLGTRKKHHIGFDWSDFEWTAAGATFAKMFTEIPKSQARRLLAAFSRGELRVSQIYQPTDLYKGMMQFSPIASPFFTTNVDRVKMQVKQMESLLRLYSEHDMVFTEDELGVRSNEITPTSKIENQNSISGESKVIELPPITVIGQVTETELNGNQQRMIYVMNLLVHKYGYPENGAAGLVGNLNAESDLIANRIEGSKAETPMRTPNAQGHITDFTVEDVMNRKYKVQGPKKPGIGIAQWTTQKRREGLFKHKYDGVEQGANILFNVDAQVDYLVNELKNKFKRVNKILEDTSSSVADASDEVVFNFERPGKVLKDIEGKKKLRSRDDPEVQGVLNARRKLGEDALNSFHETSDFALARSSP